MPIQPVSKVQPTNPVHNYKLKTVDMAEYKRIKADVEKHQPDAEASFDRMNQVLAKVFPWIIVLSIIYLAVQLSRALINGWLP